MLTQLEITRNMVDEMLHSNLFTSMVGRVVTYYPDRQTADIQPSVRRKFDDDDFSMEYPILPDVPILFPSGSGVGESYPVLTNTNVLLVFGMHPLSNWKASTGTESVLSAYNRHHSLNDAVAILQPKPVSMVGSNNFTDRKRTYTDGGTYVDVYSEGNIEVSVKGGTVITIDTEGVVNITANTVNIDDTEVNLTNCPTTITDSSVTLQDCNSTVSGGTTDISNNTVTVTGGSTTVTDSTLNVSGSDVEISGGSVGVEASDVEVNGGTVGINGASVTVDNDVTVGGISFTGHTHSFIDNSYDGATAIVIDNVTSTPS